MPNGQKIYLSEQMFHASHMLYLEENNTELYRWNHQSRPDYNPKNQFYAKLDLFLDLYQKQLAYKNKKIQIELIHNLPDFCEAFYNLDTQLFEISTKQTQFIQEILKSKQSNIKPIYLNRGCINFILCLHPEFEQTFEYSHPEQVMAVQDPKYKQLLQQQNHPYQNPFLDGSAPLALKIGLKYQRIH